MKIHSYMKKKQKQVVIGASRVREAISCFISYKANKKILLGALILLVCLPIALVATAQKGLKNISLSDEGALSISTISMAASDSKGVITIPSGTVKANPFLPYRDIGGTSTVNDVPNFQLVEPPEVVEEGSDAARVMDTIVSGILYDKFAPSAILNIEGNDYLVKKGDVVNNYRIMNITQDSVTVKLGSNVYKAGIGEILTEGTLNHNNVSNLSKKFGGEK